MFLFDSYLLNAIEKYPRVTLEMSLKDVMKSKNRLICGKYSPLSFDMEFEEIEYSSGNIKLYGWYIPVDGAKKTIVINHGRKNNRVFSLKFLQLFIDMQLNEKYNIFLPDLRNSGKSDIAKTAFGYRFAEDIKNTLIMLNEKFYTTDFVLYGFSQGGMGSALVPYLYAEELSLKGINIEKMILDSPVSNIKETILHHSLFLGLKIPSVIMSFPLARFNFKIDGRLNELRLSKVLGKVPTLILQSEKDDVTPYDMINKEYQIIKDLCSHDDGLVKPIFKVFRKGQHVRIYLQYKWEYTDSIQNFLNLE
ncbi:alpha/beta fold hydrolase [Streptobacillus felis]|uniref:Alpha/beta fold hydrolase n=1 Tax=Streptobacillus felis TaxID=1384509 RepID=A0A7Z0PGW6_9FUSO|nr:alpha/beta fold hydrolase [Streptobacillus felis]NYV27820.1 alpha/beta fold hydrolase [Streptobacillus felis]